MYSEFEKFSRDLGISSLTLHDYSGRIITPAVLEERKSYVAPIDLFSRLMSDRVIILGSAIDDDVANIIQAQLLYLSSINPKEDISLYINSPGGFVSSGLSIYDTMQLIPSDVSTICTGLAASMASVLLCAGESGKRFALPHSKVLIHQPLGGAHGQASDILIAAKEIEKCREELFSIISQHTGQPYDKVFQDGDRDYWLSAIEAKEYGLIDDIKTKKK